MTLALLTACTKPVKGPDDSSSASFLIDSLTGDGTALTLKQASWQIPTSVQWTFTACLKSRGSRADLFMQKFEVQIPNSRQVIPVATSREKPCFTWQEELPYNHLAGQSGWYRIERDIVGVGVNLGKQTVAIAINPWKISNPDQDAGKPVVFLAPGGADWIPPKFIASTDKTETINKAHLLIQDVSVKTIPEKEDKYGTTLRVEVTMKPVVQSLSATGQTVYTPIQDGQFQLLMQILANNVAGQGQDQGQGRVILMGGDLHTVAKSVNGVLKAEFKVRQNLKASQGNLELALEVRPEGLRDGASITPFNGLFRFGPGNVVGEQTGTLSNSCLENTKECAFNEILKSAVNYQSLVDQGYVQKNDRYVFSTLDFRMTSVLPGETATRRTVSYAVSTCITDTQTGEPLANMPMHVQYLKPGPPNAPMQVDATVARIDVSTNEAGCLLWSGEQFHMYYKPEEFIERGVRISKDSGFTRDLKFFLNPWTEYNIGWDAREFSSDYFETLKARKKIPSRFFIGSYNYSTQRFSYDIDSLMNLKVIKSLIVGITPRVLRYSSIVEARRAVEELRDGIYLMKVAVQKAYLDPRDNAGWMIRNTPENQAVLESRGDQPLNTSEFVTTDMGLVRVLDGTIVNSFEFAVHDLRMMRIRSNFLIELEAVDERLVQAYQIFLNRAQKQSEPVSQLASYKAGLKAVVERALQKLGESFRTGGPIGVNTGKGSVTKEQVSLMNNQLITDNFEIRSDLLQELDALTDFTKSRLPKSSEIDLNLFVERDSGLERRSFVGPVVLLSNTGSDSMRATDNLDEANCLPPENDSTFSSSLGEIESSYQEDAEINATEIAMFGNRQNNAYLFNRYFNSLSSLCFKQVDDLMTREKSYQVQSQSPDFKESLKAAFVKSFNVDYLSLTDEPLMQMQQSCHPTATSHCLDQVKTGVIKSAELSRLITPEFRAGRTDAEIFFEHTTDTRALCSFLAGHISEQITRENLTSDGADALRERIQFICAISGGLTHEIKLRTIRVGPPSFQGGMDLDLSVGESFSFGESSGWGASMDLTGFLGPLNWLAKPFGVTKSHDIHSSSGTSVGESTTLVSQIAHFDLDLLEYERCAVIGLSASTVETLVNGAPVRGIKKWLGLKPDRIEATSEEAMRRALSRGVLICEGKTQKDGPRRKISETYFYFSQSVTEGDMLDGTDLYNYPWLLSLRGMRDFITFIDQIHAQNVVNLPELIYSTTGTKEAKVRPWAIDHLREVYQAQLPSFPGFYTVLDQGEPDINAFAKDQVGQSLSKIDLDPRREVNHPSVLTEENRRKVDASKPKEINPVLGGESPIVPTNDLSH
jgi:hypothetical protein